MKLTEPQYLALKKYEDENLHNEKALKIRDDVYFRLARAGLVRRSMMLMSRITPEGRAALIEYEKRKT
jgi:hypothetical protein